jgi:LysR family transcriptional regulator, low CO2-responsive transcriptional regulator
LTDQDFLYSSMDVNHLIAFERVVREGSFNKAAWSLGVSQPTISARIQALETMVGGILFRRGRKVVLTERGVSFLPHVRRMLAALHDGLEAARSDSGSQGRLTVGVLRSLTGDLLGPALSRFHALFPEIECDAREGDHWQLVELLADNVIELGLICWPVQDPLLADMTRIFTMREPMILTVHRQHPLAARKVIDRAELLEHTSLFLLLRWWQTTPLEISELAAQARVAMDVPLETGLHLLWSGQGVGFFPKMLVQAGLLAGNLVEILVRDLPPIYRDTALVHLTRRARLSVSAQHMLGSLLEEVQSQGLEHQRL